ncbi:outer membrane protein assembly factor, partial [Brasilonema sp. UFV-L1]|nr:outer membrane protein assembly factor [Brasilonema sp. UFV-L1]
MRVSSAAILTLTTLAAGHANQAVLAAPSDTSHQTEKPDNVVVPATEETPARIETIAPPETVVTGQFSQKSGSVQTDSSNKSVVIQETPKENNEKEQMREVSFSSPSPSP